MKDEGRVKDGGRRSLSVLSSSFLLLTSSFLIVALPYLFWPGLRIDFDQDSPFRLRFARGFYPSERTADNVSFAWTAGRAVLTLRNLPRATAWRFEAKLSVPRPEPGTSEVTLLVDRVETARWLLARGTSHDLKAPVPAASSERGVQIELRVADVFIPGRDDPRELGLMVDRIAIVPESRLRSLPLAAIARLSASIGLLTAVTALIAGLPLAGAVGIATGLAVSALAFHDSALYLDFDQTVFPSLVAALLVFGCGLVLRRILRIAASAWTSAALTVGLAATFVKLLVVLHPGLTLGDSVFHLNRLQLVREGTWYFTSQAPGGQFPYPIAFYVIVSKLPIATVDWIPLMRGFAIVVDGILALWLALTVSRERGDRAGLFTLGTWHALPALFQVHGIAYLTNAFGNLVAAGALATLILVQTERLVASARHRVGLRHRRLSHTRELVPHFVSDPDRRRPGRAVVESTYACGSCRRGRSGGRSRGVDDLLPPLHICLSGAVDAPGRYRGSSVCARAARRSTSNRVGARVDPPAESNDRDTGISRKVLRLARPGPVRRRNPARATTHRRRARRARHRAHSVDHHCRGVPADQSLQSARSRVTTWLSHPLWRHSPDVPWPRGCRAAIGVGVSPALVSFR